MAKNVRENTWIKKGGRVLVLQRNSGVSAGNVPFAEMDGKTERTALPSGEQARSGEAFPSFQEAAMKTTRKRVVLFCFLQAYPLVHVLGVKSFGKKSLGKYVDQKRRGSACSAKELRSFCGERPLCRNGWENGKNGFAKWGAGQVRRGLPILPGGGNENHS